MNITQALNQVIRYVETHLDGDIHVETAAKLAGCSAYHFTRLFSYLAGMPFGEYVRNRRLSRAADDLQHDDVKIIDLCARYGYESPTAFSRAFQSLHGISPSQARTQGAQRVTFLPITFQITIQGVTSMKFRIEERDGFRAVGIKERVSVVNGQNFKVIPQMWNRIMSDGTCERITSLCDGGMVCMGICANMKGTDFDYYIATSTTGPVPEGMEALDVPPATYAVFPCKIADIADVTKRVMSEWLPNADYQQVEGPEIENYPDAENCELMIPVKPRG